MINYRIAGLPLTIKSKGENTKVSGVLLKVAKITAVPFTMKSKGENTKVAGVLLDVTNIAKVLLELG